MDTSLQVRLASDRDVAYIVSLIDRVQKQLTASGSLQIIGPLPHALVAEFVAMEAAFVFESPAGLLGSVFVQPATPESCPNLISWQLTACDLHPWFLQTLALEPEQQGRGLGFHFLSGVRALVAQRDPQANIILDCWAGNTKLRTFYTRAGFTLHGEFIEKDHWLAVFVQSAASR
ncbi:hypothetical protein KDA_63560 [Dictyobacter alpinus]|uniref:N-acetyltransferase domain-containing protein n=1 Tax=Dictyobacter alpinus TaxID=2014873 RepID=A0A402BI04_9CHLR|nr:GNAT family N-acetyltransferase [Dictyobacter alpinus]GCE30872.1 hypothetical protein KDA_63560 [Dictyobacter alpinus]